MNKDHRRDLTESLPYKSGCYIVRDGDRVLYVGQSVNIRQRWASHTHKRFIERNFPNATIEAVLYNRELEAKEAELIKKLHPVMNDKSEAQVCEELGLNPRWWEDDPA